MSKECPICGKAFELVPGKNKQKYCTKECAAEAGRRLSKDRKKQYRQEKKLQQELAPIVNNRIIDMVSEARDKNMSYGELAAMQQAKAVKIERKPLLQELQQYEPRKTRLEAEAAMKIPKRKPGRPKKESQKIEPVKKVIYEYRRIQFDECVEQFLYNEEVANGRT